jgi:hypothetical protein
LCTVGAIFRTTTRFDREKGAELDFIVAPVCIVNLAGLFDEVEKGKVVECFEFFEFHEVFR